MKKITNRIMIIVFIAFLSLSFFMPLVLADKEFSDLENRYLSQMPSFSIKDLFEGDFTEDFEDYVEEKAYYEKALSLDPNNLSALVDLGHVNFKLYDYSQALQYYLKVYNLSRDNKTVALCVANTFALVKDRDNSYKVFEEALKLEGDNYKAYMCYAIAASDFGDYEKSLDLYRQATELNPEDATAYILAGNLCSTLKDYDNAEAYYKRRCILIKWTQVCTFLLETYIICVEKWNVLFRHIVRRLIFVQRMMSINWYLFKF